MAESGKSGEGSSEDKERGGGRTQQEPHKLSPVGAASFGAKRHLPRGIVIQLTGTEGEWDSLDDSELIFSLDHDEDYPSISLSKERQLSVEDDRGLQSQAFHVPLSPSSPGSLGNCSATGPSFLSPGPSSPTHRPLANLVKSLSTELELKEGSTLRPKPLLSLVKSISTEVSRSEPEVSQSKSDSRLNLHLWKQLTRSNGDSRTAPPSPSSLSPSAEGLKGGFFKMELEDTKRKLSEAVHEPLSSMFSKIMREESAGSPKHQCKTQGAHQASSRGLGRESSTDTALSESPVRNVRKADADVPVFDWPSVRHLGRIHRSSCPVHQNRQHNEELEICTDGDMMQVLAIETHRQARRPPAGSPIPVAPLAQTSPLPQPPHPLPRMSLFCVAVLSYSYFILPLSPYFSGLALGLALGFLLGLLLIRMGSSRSRRPAPADRAAQTLLGEVILTGGTLNTEPDILKGWMNEIHEYDPETYHPALTHSVFATLEGSCLRLDSPRTNISRRATYDERVQEATFVKSRCFQLAKSKVCHCSPKVFLLPSVLAQKRVWNPKYPICIQLAGGGNSQEDEGGRSEESRGEEPGGVEPTSPKQSSCKPVHDLPTTLYLFGRTGREKEEWFRHFLFASIDAERENERDRQRPGRCVSRSGDPAPAQSVCASGNIPSSRGSSRVGSSDEDAPCTPPIPCVPAAHVNQTSSSTRGLSLLDYPSYMARLLAAEEMSPLSSPGASSTETSPTLKGNCTCDLAEYPGKSQTAWANALIGRIFWDFLRERHWADAVSHKIQKKLSKIRLPYFMNELTLTELDMGSSMPHITATSRPEVNHRGLWLELQLVYTGALQMTLQTKFNLSKLGKESGQDPDCMTETGSPRCRPILTVLADSDEESSSAGSSDEEEPLLSEPQGPVGEKGPTPIAEGTGGGRTGRKILRFVDKIAKSKYFQKATENEFIKKKFEEMSNTPLLLTVEVQELSGTLVINIPPPPTDRIWYSFCVPPKLDLRVRPKLGEREVTFCHVTEWIERKLQDEFQKVFVLPNMDDIYLPLMHSGVENPQASQHQSPQSQSSSTNSIEKIPPEISGPESD
ncbi:testis-expressed protein 2-like isoform X1 [Seriola lalandi dorsalis]|uniref:testis-expressed protein 2-like isoform X1 n=1 Tax=Seriola lalandi dorsalis TaxID=1841481 RepID=UPI000C6F5B8B|nr:testis-expressed protein 2-like isoform X1 [Seriola lalandi dorsalis]XP_023285010.1 testis-expressed protein 2-like isoform X1 [Seriola lalandi dorsalis]